MHNSRRAALGVIVEKNLNSRLRKSFRITCGVILMFFVWQLFRSDTILNAILNFCFAGAVPGTHVVLSPGSVIKVVGGAFALVVIVISVSIYIKSRQRAPDQSSASPSAPTPVIHEIPNVRSIAKAVSTQKLERTQSYSLQMQVLGSYMNLRQYVDKRLMPLSRTYGSYGILFLAVFGQLVFTIFAYIVKTIALLTMLLIKGWWYLVPYIKKCDAIIERQVLEMTKGATKKLSQYERGRVALYMLEQLKKTKEED